MTHEEAMAGINPKLIALARKIDEAEAELDRALENLAPAERAAWRNHEDKAAQASLKKAESAEEATCNARKKLGEKFRKIAATNLDELCLKARYADVWDEIGDSIISDLLAIGGEPRSGSRAVRTKRSGK